MIDGADWLCEQHFGKSLIDRDVEILDPATGTGTFICELLEHFRGQSAKLARKYHEELHANEVAILPYYVANLNIEATYAAITGEYREFANLCFVDTLDNVGLHTDAYGSTADLFAGVSDENVARIKRQNSRRISVVIGNPPYNANQANENDNNKNREYPAIDERIRKTYIAESTAQKTKLYDMYARFYRWASDRLHADGVLAFVTNRSFIDSRTFDGFRKTVAAEFAEIRLVDLGGDVRANPKLSGTKHNVFGIQTGVAIGFFVKKTGRKDRGRIHYTRRPELETAEEKLAWLGNARLSALASEEIRPDAKANWLNLTHNDFEELMPVASKATKGAKRERDERAIFKLFSLGVVTARDDWVYDRSSEALSDKVNHLIGTYNADRLRLANVRDRSALASELSAGIKWSRAVKRDLADNVEYQFRPDRLARSEYRPFTAEWLYYDRRLNEMQNLTPKLFGALGNQLNRSIVLTDAGSQKPFMVLAVAGVFDYHFVGAAAAAVALPMQRTSDEQRHDNITDWSLKQFGAHYKAGPGKRLEAPTKEGIFHYVYAVLHDPAYRDTYAQNLKRDFPRVPLHGASRADFWRWADWGRALMDLHIGYEQAAPWPLQRRDTPDTKAAAAGQAPKCVLKAEPAAGRIVIDSETVLDGVPPEAWAYRLGNRCAIDWVLDQHKEKKPKDPTIRERFDTYRFADHKERVITLLARVVTVSVETMRIVDAMRAGPR